MTGAGVLLFVIIVFSPLLLTLWISSRRVSRIHGWWHEQREGRAWTPQAWRTACQQSLEVSRRRRSGEEEEL